MPKTSPTWLRHYSSYPLVIDRDLDHEPKVERLVVLWNMFPKDKSFTVVIVPQQ